MSEVESSSDTPQRDKKATKPPSKRAMLARLAVSVICCALAIVLVLKMRELTRLSTLSAMRPSTPTTLSAEQIQEQATGRNPLDNEHGSLIPHEPSVSASLPHFPMMTGSMEIDHQTHNLGNRIESWQVISIRDTSEDDVWHHYLNLANDHGYTVPNQSAPKRPTAHLTNGNDIMILRVTSDTNGVQVVLRLSMQTQ